jgi:adenine-specific DNA methylase
LDTALDCVDEQRPSSRDAFLAAILSTASTVVNTIGQQFAQPIMPIDASGRPKRHLIKQIQQDRSQSVFDILSKWLRRYASLPRRGKEHSVLRGDYAILEQEKNIAVVYADPPYTRDHYSRYYHVLETMCLRDNPGLSKLPGPSGEVSRGMYRVDRYQSPFCIKTQAPGAFEKLFALVRNLNVPLLLSYSPYPSDREARPRLMTVEGLTELSRKYFQHVDVIGISGVAHNKLNTTRLNFAAPDQSEILLACRP